MKPLAPEGPDGADIAACRRVLCATLAYDLPGDPLPAVEDVQALLRPRWSAERIAFWTAWEHGELVGLARLHLSDRESLDNGQLAIDVHPAYRRRGAATLMLREAVRTLLAEGRHSVIVELAEGTDGARFAQARGLRVMLRDARSLLDVTTVDGSTLDVLAEEEHPSYRLAAWVDGAPDDLIASYGAAKRALRDAPTGNLELGRTEWDSSVVRQYEESAHRCGREYRVVAALHEPTGEVVGLTEVEISRWTPRRAFQDDTAVLAAHRGRGLGMWMKAEMLRWLRAERPDVIELVTWNAEGNGHIRQINERLGFKLDRWWNHCQADVPTLARRLGVFA